MKYFIGAIAAITASAMLSGCGATQPSSAVTSAGIGALGGYVAGRATGDHSDSRAQKGAIAGAIGGYIVGNEMDKANTATTNTAPTTTQSGYYHQHAGGNVQHTHTNGVVHVH